jgi:hypothetical protein
MKEPALVAFLLCQGPAARIDHNNSEPEKKKQRKKKDRVESTCKTITEELSISGSS